MRVEPPAFPVVGAGRRSGVKEHSTLNNNNRGNNRRRGRNNNIIPGRPQGGGGSGSGGGGGGQQLNRIDSRARGNAPQLLEKYRKLAQDAHMNGDRVNAEYFLQFADHYFRVIADTRLRQEEQRARRDDRWQDQGDGAGSDDGDDGGEFGGDADFPAFDQPPVYTRREREDRPERPERNDRSERQDRPNSRPDAEPAANEMVAATPDGADTTNAAGSSGGRSIYEPAQNPFVRDPTDSRGPENRPQDNRGQDNRGSRGLRPRRDDRGPRRDDRPVRDGDGYAGRDGVNEPNLGEAAAHSDDAPEVISGFDPASLPPAISPRRNADDAPDGTADSAAPAPRRRARRKPAGDDAGEALQSAS